MKIASLDDLFEHELKDVYDAEKRLVKALPKTAKAASSEELREAIEEHLRVTQSQVTRLEEVFKLIGKKAQAQTCHGMKGLLEEADQIMDADTEDDTFTDLALAGAARKVEHYEMAAYRSLVSLAEAVAGQEAVSMLEETLREEEETDQKLAGICATLLEDVSEDEQDDEEAETEELDMLEEDEEGGEKIEVEQPARTGGGKRK